jgi:hypothetical protein
MRRIYFFLLLAGMFIFSCSRDTDPSNGSIYGKWTLVSRENYSTNQVFYKDPNAVQAYCRSINPCDVIITLAKVNGTDTLTGHTITNELSGRFSFEEDSRAIHFYRLAITEVFDPQWSDNIRYLTMVNSYSFDGQFLHLYFDNKNQSLTFRRL